MAYCGQRQALAVPQDQGIALRLGQCSQGLSKAQDFLVPLRMLARRGLFGG